LFRADTVEDDTRVPHSAFPNLFTSNAFDLVIGAAYLHKFTDPPCVLASLYRALKPGGYALFFEPFELGHSILTLLFERILSKASLRPEGINPDMNQFMHAFATHTRLRVSRDKNSEWLFSEDYFQEIGKHIGFDQIRFESIHDNTNQISARAAALFAVGTNAQTSDLPQWAQAVLREADSVFSETKRKLIFEGIVTMRKPRGTSLFTTRLSEPQR
jgi:SAM-dependent methyltransferase